MNENVARLLLEEMKNGLANVQDFYGNEWFQYYYTWNTIGIVIGAILLAIALLVIVRGLKKPSEYCDMYYVAGASLSLMSLIPLVAGIINQIMLISSPKVYLTKEILWILGG